MDLDGGAGTTCFTGKVFFCQGREMGQLLLSIWDPGDKGEKAGRARSLQPNLVPLSYKVRAGRHRMGLGSPESPEHHVNLWWQSRSKVQVRSWFVGQYHSWWWQSVPQSSECQAGMRSSHAPSLFLVLYSAFIP